MGEQDNGWAKYGRVEVYGPLFEKGVFVVRPEQELEDDGDEPKNDAPCDVTKTGFRVREKFLQFGIYRPIFQSSDSLVGEVAPNLNSCRRAYGLIQQLIKVQGKQVATIFNPKHREEIFFPIALGDDSHPLDCYFAPWLSIPNQKFLFTGFASFVTAGCLFGSTLLGVDQLDGAFGIIKHNIKFFDAQKIIRIFEEKEHPYEQALFQELKRRACFIEKFAKPNLEKIVYYHLPYFDYFLFGIELFVSGRITKKALAVLFKKILKKKEEHCEKIKKIFAFRQITAEICSPFDNLFGSETELQKNDTLVNNVFKVLRLQEVAELIDRDAYPKENFKDLEKRIVQHCVHLLTTQAYNPRQQEVWANINTMFQLEKLTRIEELFKCANMVIPAVAARNREPNETCAVFPYSERQIQVEYQKMAKLSVGKDKPVTPSIFNATLLDAAFGYSPSNQRNGLLFYFRDAGNSTSMSGLISKGVLGAASKNIRIFAKSQTDEAKPEEELSPVNLCDVIDREFSSSPLLTT